MTDKAFANDTIVTVPFKSYEDGASKNDDLPPPYESPKIDFSSGWKDRWFMIIFWLHALIVLVIGLVLGLPVLNSVYIHASSNLPDANITDEERNSFDRYLGVLAYALGGAIAAGSVTSLATFFLLQLCAGRVIMCTLIIVIVIEITLVVVLFITVHWVACIMPLIVLIITLIFMSCVWKRIPFAEVHLRVGCAALHSHPSVILIALFIFIVQFLWFICWFLMVLSIMHAMDGPMVLVANKDTAVTTDIYGTSSLYTTKPMSFNANRYETKRPIYGITQNSISYNTQRKSLYHREPQDNQVLRSIVGFLLLLSWYWGANTFKNIVHFVSACTLGRWWFGNNGEQQYLLGTSTKRAFTTNFGTISFGSLVEALVKAARSSAERESRSNILACVAACLLRILEKMIGYMNDWAFIYSALTGQSYIEASRSFIELFKKRGWTMIINDTLIGHALGMINLMVGLTSAVIGGVLVYIFTRNSIEGDAITTITIAAVLGFLIGFLFSSITTTILSSCVRTVFVCFALNPAALGATHPEHLQRLTKAWSKFYPTEFTASGYVDQLPNYNTVENI